MSNNSGAGRCRVDSVTVDIDGHKHGFGESKDDLISPDFAARGPDETSIAAVLSARPVCAMRRARTGHNTS